MGVLIKDNGLQHKVGTFRCCSENTHGLHFQGGDLSILCARVVLLLVCPSGNGEVLCWRRACQHWGQEG